MADGYDTAKEAVIAAMSQAIPQSKKVEFAGVIYQDPKTKKFHFTEPQSNRKSASVKVKVKFPKGSKLHGLYHTHPPGDHSDVFAGGDIDIATKFNLPMYMGQFDGGDVKVFQPGVSDTKSRRTAGRRVSSFTSRGEDVGNINNIPDPVAVEEQEIKDLRRLVQAKSIVNNGGT